MGHFKTFVHDFGLILSCFACVKARWRDNIMIAFIARHIHTYKFYSGVFD